MDFVYSSQLLGERKDGNVADASKTYCGMSPSSLPLHSLIKRIPDLSGKQFYKITPPSLFSATHLHTGLLLHHSIEIQ